MEIIVTVLVAISGIIVSTFANIIGDYSEKRKIKALHTEIVKTQTNFRKQIARGMYVA